MGRASSIYSAMSTKVPRVPYWRGCGIIVVRLSEAMNYGVSWIRIGGMTRSWTCWDGGQQQIRQAFLDSIKMAIERGATLTPDGKPHRDKPGTNLWVLAKNITDAVHCQ